VVKIKGIAPGKYKGSNKNKYKLNCIYVNYNNKTGFYENTIGFSFMESQQKQKQENVKHWKCEKCNNFFSRFRQLKQHKEEHHAY
jgi:hypothetical protein